MTTTPNFRALCAELLRGLDENRHPEVRYPGHLRLVMASARAALADEPAVPEGREPVAVTGQPSDEELLRMAAEAIDPYDEIGIGEYEAETECAVEVYGSELIAFARAVLGKDGPAVPQGMPTDQELHDLAAHCVKGSKSVEWVILQALARWGNPVPAPPTDVSQLSDGYHTFAELYEHRYSLMLALMRAQPHICWFSRRHADGELPFGSDDWFIVGAELPGAPITYHLPAALYSLAQKTGATELPTGRPWDGHTAADVVQRLRDWAIESALPDAEEVAELVAWLRHEAESQHPGSGEALPSDVRDELLNAFTQLTRAAELLQRQALVPVSVSERLPGPGDCAPWPEDSDASGWCWAGIDEEGGWNWEQLSAGCLAMFPDSFTHWLPAHALPIPQQQESDNG